MSDPTTASTDAPETPADDSSAIEAKLKAAKAAQAKAKAERDARAEEAELARELARTEQATIDEAEIGKLIEKHGALGVKIQVINTELGAIVVGRPSALKYKRFQDSGKTSYEDVLAFAQPCVLYPSAPRFSEILDDMPGTLSVVANTIVDLAGHQQSEKQKK